MGARLALVVAFVLGAAALPAAATEYAPATESPPAGDSAPACTPSGTALSIAASNKKFDKDCLAAPAGEAFTIAFDNQDTAVRHNVAIYDTSAGDKALFKGEVIVGPSQTTYSVPAQAAGTYEFRCDPHDDTMVGTFVVS